jgi:hypothetical protein
VDRISESGADWLAVFDDPLLGQGTSISSRTTPTTWLSTARPTAPAQLRKERYALTLMTFTAPKGSYRQRRASACGSGHQAQAATPPPQARSRLTALDSRLGA